MLCNNTGADQDKWNNPWEELLRASEKALALEPGIIVRHDNQIMSVTSYVYLDADNIAVVDIQDIDSDSVLTVDPVKVEVIDHLSALAEQV